MQATNLIDKCKRGDSSAQRAFLEKYTPLLYNVALRYAIDRSQAKDILQDSWIRIFNGLEKYKDEGKLEAWLTRIVINVAYRKFSSKEMKQAVYTDTFFDTAVEQPAILSELHYDDLLRLVNQLPDICREVFKMAVIDDLKHKEIAEIMKIKESTSRAHLTRAKKKLRELIQDYDKVEYYGE